MAARQKEKVTAPELEEFIIDDVHLTGVELGTGSYGIVEEAEILHGLKVAAKKLHSLQVKLGSPQQVGKPFEDFQLNKCSHTAHKKHSLSASVYNFSIVVIS